MYTLDIEYLGNVEPEYQQPLFETNNIDEAWKAFKECPTSCALFSDEEMVAEKWLIEMDHGYELEEVIYDDELEEIYS